MPNAILGTLLALQVKGFDSWEPRTKVVVCLVGLVVVILLVVALVRKVGWVAILLPVVVIGSIVVMNRHSGCLEHIGDLKEKPAK